MPDIVDVITQQHRQLEQLLEQAQQSDGEEVRSLLQQVAEMLRPHSDAEEAFVYPAIRERRGEEEEQVHDSVAEHQHADQLLRELLSEEPGSPGYDGKLAAFVGEIKHHVEEEESDLLPVLKENASDSEREQMGERFLRETTGGTTGGTGSGAEGGASTSGSSGTSEMSKQELYEKAKEQDVPGRSSMSKEELEQAVEKE